MATPLRFILAAACAPLAALAAVSPNNILTADQAAARFLSQATFGPSAADIAAFQPFRDNYGAWIDREAAKPVTLVQNVLSTARAAGSFTTADRAINRRARVQVMLTADDQLRQRVAYALSQIMVISDNDSVVQNGGDGPAGYWDVLARHALGNFRDLLMDVTRHPMMGRYLTHYRNRKANAAAGTMPDENYAREVMQLFTIGLYHLNLDGTFVTDAAGRPLETYTNENITQFAKVFTGFTDASTNNTGTGTGRLDFPSASQDYLNPMRMWEAQHDTEAKTLLNYPGARKVNLPAGQPGLQDVGDALDNLFEHPSTAPFISRQLIQRLVSSNPSPDYIRRVASVFVNNGRGVRGDLLAVVKAVLLDPEARSTASITNPRHGKLREPFLRVTHTLRAFRFTATPSATITFIPFDLGFSETTMGQFPLGAPSVFNFYSPDYEPPGPIKSAGLVGPEYQILNAVFGITLPNTFNTLINSGTGTFRISLADQEALAGNVDALLDNLNLLLTHGMMSAETRAAIRTAVTGITAAMVPSGSNLNLQRARLATYLTLNSPDYAVLK